MLDANYDVIITPHLCTISRLERSSVNQDKRDWKKKKKETLTRKVITERFAVPRRLDIKL